MVVEIIITEFLLCLNKLKNKGILSDYLLMRYEDFNIHSLLQYCLIIAAENSGLMGIPEYKLRLSRPINKYNIDPRLVKRRGESRSRRIRTIRADVGFLKDYVLVGVGEIYTPDEIHGCLPSRQLEEPWLSPYEKLIHIAKYEKDVKFVILTVGLWTLSRWKDARRKTLQEWCECWKKAVRHLSRYKKVAAIYIKKLDDVETEILSNE